MMPRLTLLVAVVCLLVPVGAIHAAETPQPNILWITCEDISPNLGCYGDEFACTPTLDRLAGQGTRYLNAFATTGVCSPARSSLVTGVWPSSLGSHNMRCTTRLPESIKCFPEYLRHAGYYCTNNSKTDYNFAVPDGAWDATSNRAHWRGRQPGQPFFAVFNFTTTHESQIRLSDEQFFRRTQRLTPEQRHDPAEVPLPPQHPDTSEVRQNWARYHDLITAMDYQVADLLGQLEADGLTDETIVFFFSDHGAGMPGCKKWVWESGLHVPLIVRFPAKYARWAPTPPGGTTDRMASFIDFAPTVLSLTGVSIPEHMQGNALLGDKAAEPQPCVFAIRDRMAERYDMVRVVRDGRYQYLRNFMPHRSWSQRISYTHQMPTMQVWQRLADAGQLNAVQGRYFLPTKPIEELYDTQADPHQVNNLADRPEHRDVLVQMRGRLRDWMRQTHDMGLLPELEIDVRSRGTTPYAMARDPRKHPQERLLAAAELANRMDAAHLPRLVELLADNDAAVRYWAVEGLIALGPHADAAQAEVERALTDASPVVRVAAAEVLCNLGEHAKALPVLVAALEHPTPFVRLRSLNVLDAMGAHAESALPQIRRAALTRSGHVGDYVGRLVQYIPSKFKP